jgi:precorrin-3B C17-methyltransferase
MSGAIIVVGIGPGAAEHMAPAAMAAIEGADVIVGYRTYLAFITHLAPEVPREASGMRQEVERIQRAVDIAMAGGRVAVVSGGDPGIYGMAGLVYEVLAQRGIEDLPVEIVPGMSALSAAAALLGAPLMTDFAVISLSDQLTPRDAILNRVTAAAQADFVICFYNPKGWTRVAPWQQACQALMQYRLPSTPVGVVRNATRPDQSVQLLTLAELLDAEVDMLSLVLVGNSATTVHNGKMITPRGYGEKYDLTASAGHHAHGDWTQSEEPHAAS